MRELVPYTRPGGLPERTKGHAWRACRGATLSRVRIPRPPPTGSDEGLRVLRVRPPHVHADLLVKGERAGPRLGREATRRLSRFVERAERLVQQRASDAAVTVARLRRDLLDPALFLDLVVERERRADELAAVERETREPRRERLVIDDEHPPLL